MLSGELMGTSVYILTLNDGRRYVGISVDPEGRLRTHLKADSRVGRALRKYGLRSMEVVVEDLDRDAAGCMERELITSLGTLNGLNLTLGGQGSVGWTPSERTRQSISESMRALGPEKLAANARVGGLAAREKMSPEQRRENAARASAEVRAARSARMKAYHASKTPEQRKAQARMAREARFSHV